MRRDYRTADDSEERTTTVRTGIQAALGESIQLLLERYTLGSDVRLASFACFLFGRANDGPPLDRLSTVLLGIIGGAAVLQVIPLPVGLVKALLQPGRNWRKRPPQSLDPLPTSSR
jgi:hypothetical protein